MLILQRKKGEAITIDGNIKVSIVEITSDKVKLAIEAPKSISIMRDELIEAAKNNKEAATPSLSAFQDFTKNFSTSNSKETRS